MNIHIQSLKVWRKFLLPWLKYSIFARGLFFIGAPCMYINDMADINAGDDRTEQYLFADDAKIYRHIKCNADHQTLQIAVDKVQHWSDTWLLKLNVDK